MRRRQSQTRSPIVWFFPAAPSLEHLLRLHARQAAAGRTAWQRQRWAPPRRGACRCRARCCCWRCWRVVSAPPASRRQPAAAGVRPSRAAHGARRAPSAGPGFSCARSGADHAAAADHADEEAAKVGRRWLAAPPMPCACRARTAGSSTPRAGPQPAGLRRRQAALGPVRRVRHSAPATPLAGCAAACPAPAAGPAPSASPAPSHPPPRARPGISPWTRRAAGACSTG